MKYLKTKEGSLEEAGYRAMTEKPDSSSSPIKEIKEEIKEEVKKDNPISTEDNFESKLQEMTIVMEAEGDKEKYQKFFKAALKKFGVDSPADFKSDEEKKKFFNYVDKNYKGDHEESVDLEEADIKMVDQVFDSGKQFKDFFKFMKSKFNLSLKGKVTPGENGDDFTLTGSDTNIIKYLRYLDKGGTLYLQIYKKKGNVYSAEEVDLEKKLNDNVDETLDRIREANVEKSKSMRSILADIWKSNEGKNPFENKKEEEDKPLKKTLTGKKTTKVEIEPEIK